MEAIPEQSTKKVLIHFIATFRCPLEIHTDQGKYFESKLFKAVCDLLEIAKTRTTPYRPSSKFKNITPLCYQ